MNIVLNRTQWSCLTRDAARVRLIVFAKLFRSHRLRANHTFWGMRGWLDVQLASGYTLRQWCEDASVDVEARRWLKSVINKVNRIEDCSATLPIERLINAGVRAEVTGTHHDEFLAASILDALCILLTSSAAPAAPTTCVSITRKAPFPARSPDEIEIEPLAMKLDARQASDDDGMSNHQAWLGGPASDELVAFRAAVSPQTAVHKRASAYGAPKGKHVRGKSTQARQRAARSGGESQFRVDDDDASIGRRENQVLVDAWCGRTSSPPILHGDAQKTWHIYHDTSVFVGYVGGTGAETSWVRVECTSGNAVHSHPRPKG